MINNEYDLKTVVETYIKRVNITKKKLAEIIGINSVYFGNIINGHTSIPNGFIEKMIVKCNPTYKFTKSEMLALHNIKYKAMQAFTIKTEGLSDCQKELVSRVYDGFRYHTLDDDRCHELMQTIGRSKIIDSKRPEVVTLSGSSKFKEDFIRIEEELSLQNKIVISLGLFGHADNKFETVITPEVKKQLDHNHMEKIKMSDSLYVINKGGYIGESTKNEIQYAVKLGKKIYYMENV